MLSRENHFLIDALEWEAREPLPFDKGQSALTRIESHFMAAGPQGMGHRESRIDVSE